VLSSIYIALSDADLSGILSDISNIRIDPIVFLFVFIDILYVVIFIKVIKRIFHSIVKLYTLPDSTPALLMDYIKHFREFELRFVDFIKHGYKETKIYHFIAWVGEFR
jgi:hypothetical protein